MKREGRRERERERDGEKREKNDEEERAMRAGWRVKKEIIV